MNPLASLPAQPSWQMLEVLLFALQSVAPAIRSRMPGGRMPDASSGAVCSSAAPPHCWGHALLGPRGMVTADTTVRLILIYLSTTIGELTTADVV